mmetsp:Transcript_89678/g.290176  ORF Transcript_89678/g.290176 Transcript_89678/m.290176 type:complete len:256 (-) Transcript_89678:664-1431(-)
MSSPRGQSEALVTLQHSLVPIHLPCMHGCAEQSSVQSLVRALPKAPLELSHPWDIPWRTAAHLHLCHWPEYQDRWPLLPRAETNSHYCSCHLRPALSWACPHHLPAHHRRCFLHSPPPLPPLPPAPAPPACTAVALHPLLCPPRGLFQISAGFLSTSPQPLQEGSRHTWPCQHQGLHHQCQSTWEHPRALRGRAPTPQAAQHAHGPAPPGSWSCHWLQPSGQMQAGAASCRSPPDLSWAHCRGGQKPLVVGTGAR